MEKNNLFFRGFSVYHRVDMREFAKHERNVEVARVAACHNAWTKKKTLKILPVLSTCTVIT